MSDIWGRSRKARLTLFAMLVVFFVLFRIVGALENTSSIWFANPPPTRAGMTVLPPDLSLETGWQRVTRVIEAGPAQMAGLQPGDAIRFSVPWELMTYRQPGEEVPVTIERDGARFAATITVQQAPITPPNIIGPILPWIMLTLAVLLLTRGRGNRAATMLALALISFRSPPLLLWFPDWAFVPVALFVQSMSAFQPYYFIMFGLALTGAAASQRISRVATVAGIALSALFLLILISRMFAIPLPIGGNTIQPVIRAVALLISLALVGLSYSRIDQSARNRIKIVFAAFGALILAQFAGQVAPYFGFDGAYAFQPFVFLASFLLAYTVLAQRLFDFGFVINRTLVYGAAAFTLLVTFGLVEYLAKSAIPAAWPDAGPFISAGIAVLLFLTFHRLHHWFEHHIERLFFGDWQRAEAALKRFVESAGHFDKSSALCKAAADAISRFAEGAGAALYVRGSDGAFGKAAGRLAGASKSYPDDDPAFALLRGERKPVELARAHGALPGELALPMLEQGSLIGFILLAAKPDGTHYRPGERELLSWAVHHIGLDLRALHARQLEAENFTQAQRIAALSEDKERLTSLLAGSRPQPA